MLFNCEDELTADNLDALWRQDMQDERNQQTFKDALRSTDPDEVNMERREREWKATWDDDAWSQAREFELFDPEYPVEELEAQKETDANQRLPAPVQTNTTQSAALVKTSGSPAAIQPFHGAVLSRPAQNAVRGRVGSGNNITPYEVAQGLIQTIPISAATDIFRGCSFRLPYPPVILSVKTRTALPRRPILFGASRI